MSHRVNRIGGAGAGVLAACVLVAAVCQSSSMPVAPGAAVPVLATAIVEGAKVDVCHRTEGDNPFLLTTVDDHAVASHLEHGDGHPGGPVPGQSGSLFATDCTVVTALVCPCSANMTEEQLVAVLDAELGSQQADCASSGTDVGVRGILGNTTELMAKGSEMSCTLRTSAANVSVASLSESALTLCAAQAVRIVPQLRACRD